MTKVTNDDVIHLASLSALALEPSEVDSLRDDLQQILNYVNQLAELDTSAVEPTYQVTGLTSVYRADEVEAGPVSSQQLLDLAPARDGQSIKVPKVL